MMNLVNFISSSVDGFTLTILLFLIIFSVLARLEIAKIYLDRNPNEYYTWRHNFWWRVSNVCLVMFFIITLGSKFVTTIKFVVQDNNPYTTELIKTTPPAKKLDPTVFELCLTHTNTDVESSSDTVKECREAASMEILK